MSDKIMNPYMKYVSAALFVLMAGSRPAWTDEGARFPMSPVYRDECGSCHVAYPPRLLPARSWTAIMAGLDRHFGSDASLDAAKAREIENFLVANSGRPDRSVSSSASGSPPRITETPWFRREHRDGHEGLAASVWQSAAVRSPANCAACHSEASAGDYSERNIHIPRTR